MAKAKSGKAKSDVAESPKGESAERRRYEIEDGLRTLSRAEEIKGDKGLMKEIAEHAADQADMARRTAGMVKAGLISDKQAAKLPGAEGKAEAGE